jgi:predicted alpha/beta-hydrolase family hydrolase
VKRFERELVKGWLHEPASPNGDALALTHGAGGNCEAPLLVAIAEAFAASGTAVLRFDLPYRQQRPHGAPFPAQSGRDREGIARAVQAIRELATKRVLLSGHSYGGRQSTMAVAEQPGLADALMLLSYPLHPPGKLDRLRVEHFPNIRIPALFVHGTRDTFGTIAELQSALPAITARTELMIIEGAGHGIKPVAAPSIVQHFHEFLGR